ncbi:MAG: glycosyltransferase [Rickettsiales bacterium]|nr:glycosyltransferase [Rickettsiales bacterium]
MAEKTPSSRLLMIANAHPAYSNGEVGTGAYALFQQLGKAKSFQPFYLAAMPASLRTAAAGSPFQIVAGASDEMFFCHDVVDPFLQSQTHGDVLYEHFRHFLETLQPQVIHLHHSVHLGLEALAVAKVALPGVRLVYTLHDFLPMCHRDGVMLKSGTNALCTRAGAADCHRCFPTIAAEQFRLRELFIKAHLAKVDRFVAPSIFLAERFISWGLPEKKISVIEPGHHDGEAVPQREVEAGAHRNVFGYFGEISPYKGMPLLQEAVEILVKGGFTDFRLEIFGDVSHQAVAFQQAFQQFLETYHEQVTWHGPAEPETWPEHMRGVDWVVAPSLWWENAPISVQEAFHHLRPVICADVGGMAEKVKHHVNGVHFKAQRAISLAEVLYHAATDEKLWKKLVRRVTPGATLSEHTEAHKKLYKELLK